MSNRPARGNVPVCVGIAFVLLTTSCGLGAMIDRERHRIARAEDHVYAKPCQQMWRPLRDTLSLHDMRLAPPASPDKAPEYSRWIRVQKGDSGATIERVRIAMTAVSDSRCRVKLTREVKNSNHSFRDGQMELNLLEAADPAAAKRYDAEAHKKYP